MVRAFVVGLTAVLVGVASQASSADPGAEKLRNGLSSLASSLGELVDPTQYQDPADLGQLADALPLSDLDPLNGLDFDEVLAKALDRGTSEALTSVDDYVEALDDEDVTVGGMPVDVTATSDGTGTSRVITVGIGTDPATAFREVPLALPTDAVDLGGGTLRVGFDLDATLVLDFDASEPDVGKALALQSAPVISLDVVVSTPKPVTLSADLGFTDVQVGATVSEVSVGLDLALQSPHPAGSPDAGRITAYDWTTTSLEDLVDVTRTGKVAASLALDSDLLEGKPDVTLSVTDTDLSDGFEPEFSAGQAALSPAAAPTSTSLLEALADTDLLDFTNVSPSQVLTGVGQVAAAVSALQSQSDVPLPFLQGGVGRSLDMVSSLVDALRQQTVVCGTTATSPPTGSTVGLEVGDKVHCQATTTDTVKPGTTSWTVVPGTGTLAANSSGSDADGTVAAVPNRLVQVDVVTAGVPPVVTVAYEDAADAAKGASQPVPTAQSLRDLLVDQAGFDDAGTTVAYDPDSSALTFTLKRTLADGVAKTVSFDVADQLEGGSGLVGLSQVGGASASVKAKGAVVELTLGVLLADQQDVPEAIPAEDPDTTSTFLDRFFVTQGAGGRVLSVDDLVVDANATLEGRLGFLDVTANGKVDVRKTTGAAHVLSLSLAGLTDVQAVDRTAVSDAVPLTALLNDLGTHVAPPVLGVSADGSLLVAAAVNGTPLASGSVGFALGPVTSVADLTDPTKLTVTTDGDYDESLKKFWDLAQDDPLALLDIILDSLSELAASTEDVPALDEQLPLVGTSPRELLVQFDRLRLAAEELRGAPTATLVCRNTSSRERDAVSALVGDVLACRAENLTAASTVRWTVAGGTVSSGDTATATVGPPVTPPVLPPAPAAPAGPTASEFAFEVTAPGLASPNNEAGFRIAVSWTDPVGDHTAQLPSLGAPPTLQALNDALTRKLGLPADALVLSLEDVDAPGSAPAAKTLRMKLGYGVCTNGNVVIDECDSAAPGTRVDKLGAPLNVELGNLGEAGGPSYGLTTSGDVTLEYAADALLDVGIPLTADPTPFVFGGTGASVDAGVDGSGLGFKANIGPLGVKLGTEAGGGAGIVKLAGGLGVGTGEGADEALSISEFASQLDFSLSGGDEQDCGPGDFDNDAATEPTELKGEACARLALTAVIGADVPLGDLGLSIADLTDPSALQVEVDPLLLEKLKKEVLSVEFLLRALPPLLDQLEASLRTGSAGGQKLPVIGGALDAGADVVGKLNSFVTPASLGLADAVKAVGTAGPLKTTIQTHLYGFVGPGGTGLLLDNSGNGTIGPEDVTMEVLCGAGACDPDAATSTVQDIRLTFSIGQGVSADGEVVQGCAAGDPGCQVPAGLPFDIGLDGLPLRISGALDGGVMWRVGLDFGLSRSDGPYLGVNHEEGGKEVDDVEIGAKVTLGDRADACTTEDADFRSGVDAAKGYSDTRCLQGSLGFLNVNLRDSAGSLRTGIGLVAGLRLTADGVADNGRLRLTDIVGGRLGADYRVAAEANVNLLFRAGITSSSGAEIGFPAVLGTFTAGWEYDAGSGAEQGAGAQKIAFEDIHLDGGAFMSKYLQPITEQVKGVTSPLKPVIDTLQTPIPVVSELAAMVGEDPVTLIGLADKIGGQDLSLVKSVIAFLEFADDFPPGQSLLIPLKADKPVPGSGVVAGEGGSFEVDTDQAVTPKTPSMAASLIKKGTAKAGSDLGGALGEGGASTPTGDGRYSTFGVPGLDIPVLREPSKVFSVLMGQDITLVEYELGGLRATAGFSYSFGPFMVGPVPVVITIGGGVELDGHFALGYDTSGLRAVFGGAGPEAVLNGLYLRDFDRSGHDVPEIRLAGTVYAGAAVSIAIVTAGIEAGITLTVGLDLDDKPDNDGRMNFDEIVDRLPNPICLFTVEGSLDAFLKAFVEFDFFVASKRFDFTIVEVHLLDFSLGCDLPEPQPAEPLGDTLYLNIGDRADKRGIHTAEPDEKFVVRPLETGGFSVEVFGAYVEYPGSFSRIHGDGKAGKDEIVLAPGVRTTGTTGTGPDTRQCRAETPCELPWPAGTHGELYGGPDDDDLTGGSGSDTLEGQGGNDKLAGGAGVDVLKGGSQSDTVDGGVGDDEVYGGTGAQAHEPDDLADNLQGGPGSDTVHGGSGDDLIAGGPGVQPGTAGAPESSFDGADVLAGGSGADSIAGHEGGDTIHGDAVLPKDCTVDGAGPTAPDLSNDDRIEGGPGKDTVVAGSGADTVKGNDGDDVLCGGTGADTIDGDETGQTGNDTVRGGPGNDVLNGRQGDDVVDGGADNDWALGGAGKDGVLGGTGRDRVEGSEGDDLVVGEDGELDGVPGSLGTSAATNATRVSGVDDTTDENEARLDCALPYDAATVTPGNSDCVIGGLGNDAVLGGGGPDTLLGDDGNDWLDGASGKDVVRGGLLDDVAYGGADDDSVFGDSGDDDLFGGLGVDVLHGGVGVDDIDGNEAGDTLFGDEGDDRLVGGSRAGSPFAQLDGGDQVRGGPGHDVLLGDNGTISAAGLTGMTASGTAAGTFGDDFLYGEDGADQAYGQQGADLVDGGVGPDHLLGDLGAITPAATAPAVWPGGAPNRSVQLLAQAVGGVDTVLGGPGDDHGYGGAANDALEGGTQDDVLEGNPGQDTILGQDGEDDLIGGSSTASVPDPALDEGELVVEGGKGVDVITGDNADITRTVATPTTWALDPITGGAERDVVLRYRAEDSCGTKCGGDVLRGDGDDDQVFGQGGNDTVDGGTGDDYLEGNQATDLVHGNADDDDVLGGSSDVASGTGTARAGRPDSLDTLFGDDGADVIAGDNAVVLRIPTFSPVTDRPGMAERRQVALLDLGTSAAGTFGGDTVSGGSGVDVAYGQSGADVVKGNDDDDYLEGGQDADLLEGGGGADDLVGGSGVVLTTSATDAETATGQPDTADQLFGGGGGDLVLGDNAQVLRREADDQVFSPLTDRLDVERRTLRLLDLAPVGNAPLRTWPTPVSGRSGADSLSGGTGVDVLLGQDAGDWISGGPGDDYAEGNGNPQTVPLPSPPGDPDRLYGDQLLGSVQGAPALAAGASVGQQEREGFAGPADPGSADGQDDLIGGSSNIAATLRYDAPVPAAAFRDGFRDGGDVLVGNGGADFELGDNGRLVRERAGAAYLRYEERYEKPYAMPATGGDTRAYVRHAVRLDVPSAGVPVAGTSGADDMQGNGDDDFMWGQSGNDTMRGGDGNDDLVGELGDDELFGEAGEDAMVGDRGGIISRYIDGSAGDPTVQSVTQNAPPAEVFQYFRKDTLDRRVHLQRDVSAHTGLTGSVDAFAAGTMPSQGEIHGGADRLRGGPDHDSLHAAFGNDLANGDSGGDAVFGGGGGDVLWGGRGCDPVLDTLASSPDCYTGGAFTASARGVDDRMVDHVLGGYGGLDAKNAGTPELLDFRPRGSLTTRGTTCANGTGPTSAGGGATIDPCAWLEMTDIGTGGGPTQHYQGTDWLYGGYDRDVLEGDVTANGPNPGDRLMDWLGTYNLYNHCNAAYGGFNDVRQFSPGMQSFMQAWAYGLGAGPTLAEVGTPGTTGFAELGFVDNKNPDTKDNGGSPYAGTPGNFTQFSCAD